MCVRVCVCVYVCAGVCVRVRVHVCVRSAVVTEGPVLTERVAASAYRGTDNQAMMSDPQPPQRCQL